MFDLVILCAIAISTCILITKMDAPVPETTNWYELIDPRQKQTVRVCFFLDGNAFSDVQDYYIGENSEVVVRIDMQLAIDMLTQNEEGPCCQSNDYNQPCECGEPCSISYEQAFREYAEEQRLEQMEQAERDYFDSHPWREQEATCLYCTTDEAVTCTCKQQLEAMK